MGEERGDLPRSSFVYRMWNDATRYKSVSRTTKISFNVKFSVKL
jgi:hypothetical protein